MRMLASVVYLLCAITSLFCMILLLRNYLTDRISKNRATAVKSDRPQKSQKK